MEFNNSQNRCMRCFEPITNPVCVKCHLDEVRFFLKDMDVEEDLARAIITDIKNYVRGETLHQENCILCSKENLSTCSYCFFLISARVIKKWLGKGETVDTFLELFNYQFGHSEYQV